MRVLFVFPFINLTGGIRVHIDYANELSAAGHDVTIAYPLWPYRFQYNVRIQYLEFRKNLKSNIEVGWYALKTRLIRPPLIRTRWLPEADVVIAVGWPTVRDVFRLGRGCGKKVHIVMHHESGTGPEEKIRRIYRMPFYRIAYSRSVAAEIRKQFDCEIQEIVPNGVNPDVFHPEPVARKNRMILMLYHPDPRKGAQDGLEALHEVRMRIPEVEIQLIGPVMPSKPLPGGVRFTFYPSDRDLRFLYNTASALLYPSRVEGFGLPPLEAMACGCPVVTTAVGAVPEFARDDFNAFVVEPGDIWSMADGLSSLLQNQGLRQQFSAEGLRTASQYSLNRVAPLFESALVKASAWTGLKSEKSADERVLGSAR